jgi:nucleoside-diphosphate-sugar epimerase
MKRKTALVAGALGITGRNLVKYLTTLEDWRIVALSRRPPDFETPAYFLSVDLLNRKDCEEKLGALNEVTHIFFAAYQERPNEVAQVATNKAMLVNLIETLDTVASIDRIVLVEGAKYYGAHLGPYKTPAKESDPRHMPPNFYYDQEDFLRQSAADRGWTWAAVRPSGICGFALGNPMNISMVIAVYAAISKELKLPLRFPGRVGAYRALMEMTDAEHLARAMVWAATDRRCANEAFNITNGDYVRWEHLWPVIAEHFGMEVGPPLPLSLTTYMEDKGPLWDRMVQTYGLRPYRFDEIVAWPFGDALLRIEYDVMSDTGKARRCGFSDVVDTEEMFVRLITQFRADRVIP